MLDWHAELDIYGCCEKKNTPPVIMVNMDQIEGTYATWSSDGYSFSLSGTAIDPDGGAVSLSATMCGETTNSFTQNGDTWIVSLSIAKCVAQGLTTQYDVELSVTDSVGAISTESISIPDPYASDNSGTDTVDDTSEEESGLPNLGMLATIVAMLGAALLLRKD